MSPKSDNHVNVIGKKPAYRVLAEKEGKKSSKEDRIKSGTTVTVTDPENKETLAEGMVLGSRVVSSILPSPLGKLAPGRHYFIGDYGWVHADAVAEQ